MKRASKVLLVLLTLALTLCVYATGEEQTDIKIDVVDGHFISGEYDIPLAANIEKPIRIGQMGTDVIVRIATSFGVVDLNLGSGRVALNKRATPYVALMTAEETAEGAGKGSSVKVTEAPKQTGICPGCGMDRALGGDHTRLECAHYRCVVGSGHPKICPTCRKFTCNRVDHTPCPGCGVGACRHDDMKCDWVHNPVPTTFKYKNEEGKWEYLYLDPEGRYYIGVEGTPAPSWNPAATHMFLISTPKPTASPTP